MRKEAENTPPSFGQDADDVRDIREWIAVLEQTLQTCSPETDDGDADLTRDLERALEALRGALNTPENSNSA